jgi:hypothetical protein
MAGDTPTADAIIGLLRRCPGTWEVYDPDRLTESESTALFRLVAAGMVERRCRMRWQMAGQALVVEATITVTGEFGGVEALKPLAAIAWQHWEQGYRAWRTDNVGGDLPFHCERLAPEEWRLTTEGIAARTEVDEGTPLRTLEFVMRRGFYANRHPVRGQGALVKVSEQPVAANHSTVNIGNWDIGGQAIGAVLAGMFEQLRNQPVPPAAVGPPPVAAKEGVDAPVLDGNPTVENWPPDQGWHFRPGEFAFRGKSGQCSGKIWQLLKLFVDSRGPIDRNTIRDTLWKDEGHLVDDTNIRVHVSNLRKALREAFGLDSNAQPIVPVDRGEQMAWRLDESVLV